MGRIFFVDHHIDSHDGHYFEIANLLQAAAADKGYQSELATQAGFHPRDGSPFSVEAVFRPNRTSRWSLGVDGVSKVCRDLNGKPIGGSAWQNFSQQVADRLARKRHRPTQMINHWATDLVDWLRRHRVQRDDVLIINTADDFQLLALAKAIQAMPVVAPKSIHLIFHLAMFGSDETGGDLGDRAKQAGKQIRLTEKALKPSDLRMWATTDPLTQSFRAIGVEASTIPYPIRPPAGLNDGHIHKNDSGIDLRPSECCAGVPLQKNGSCENLESELQTSSGRLNLLFGGWPRREKGVRSITQLLAVIQRSHLEKGNFRVSMQLPLRKWKRIVPRSLHESCHLCTNPSTSVQETLKPLIDVITSSISTQQYQSWLDTADIGLFLYDRQRYEVRLSAVLLEMLVRGVPVIVPDRCWLADQVHQAESQEQLSIGLVYRDIEEVPSLLDQMADRYQEFRANSLVYAPKISQRHAPEMTLQAMGLGQLVFESAA